MAATPSSKVFLDSAYVIALAQSDDAHHPQAIEMARRIAANRSFIITTRAVLLEIGNALARVKSRDTAIHLVNTLANSSSIEIVPLTESLAKQGWDLFCQREDKSWSWTDCISFLVMQERDLEQALTSDSHFEQAGFIALLR